MIENALKNVIIEKKKNQKKIRGMNKILNMDDCLKGTSLEEYIGRPVDQKGIKRAAIREVETNYLILKEYLDELRERGFDINDDLTKIEGMDNDKYNKIIDNIQTCMLEIKEIPKRLAIGKYFPSYSKTGIEGDDLIVLDIKNIK